MEVTYIPDSYPAGVYVVDDDEKRKEHLEHTGDRPPYPAPLFSSSM